MVIQPLAKFITAERLSGGFIYLAVLIIRLFELIQHFRFHFGINPVQLRIKRPAFLRLKTEDKIIRRLYLSGMLLFKHRGHFFQAIILLSTITDISFQVLTFVKQKRRHLFKFAPAVRGFGLINGFKRPDKALRRRQRQAKIWLFSYLRFRFIKEPRAKRPGLLHHNCQSKWFSAMYFHNAQACNDWIMPFSLSSCLISSSVSK